MNREMTMQCAEPLLRLAKPTGVVDVVLDTDAYNEIDDQFALAYLIRSSDALNLRAIYAAPFYNGKVSGPDEGMEKSYQEILNILSLTGREDPQESVYRGSTRFLPDENTPVDSAAARDLIERSDGYSSENPLYVVAIGAITNVASALIMKPEIKDRIVVIWLGGHALDWPDTYEFNLLQDVAAARIVFGCGVPLVQLPCMGVVSAFTTTRPELEHWLRGKNKLCDYLVDITISERESQNSGTYWSKPIWDVTAVAWLLGDDFMQDRPEHSPIPQYDFHYSRDSRRHLYRYVYHINRDKLMEDLFTKLARE